jgi:hypothetical protein
MHSVDKSRRKKCHQEAGAISTDDHIRKKINSTHLIARRCREGSQSTGDDHSIDHIQTDEQPHSISRLFDLIGQSDPKNNTPKRGEQCKGQLDPEPSISCKIKERRPKIQTIDCPNDSDVEKKYGPHCCDAYKAPFSVFY